VCKITSNFITFSVTTCRILVLRFLQLEFIYSCGFQTQAALSVEDLPMLGKHCSCHLQGKCLWEARGRGRIGSSYKDVALGV
jgi:hypothetical protein